MATNISIKEAYEYLRSIGKAHKQQDVADTMGVSKENISRAFNGNERYLTESFLSRFNDAYGNIFNISWLLTGEGEMLSPSKCTTTPIFEAKATEATETLGMVTLYDIEAAANLKTLLVNKDQNILGQISIPNIPKCDGAVYVKGDSMYPLLKSGDIVAYKEIPLDIQHIFFGEMYLISIDMDGDEYLTVKYVNHSDKGEDWIKLVSYNQYHQPKDFPLSSVRAMAIIKLSIRMNTMK